MQLKYASSQAMNETLGITEVGEATGLPSSALRYYEREGLIQPAGRSGGRRHYAPDVLQRLAVIALLQEVGFTIAEIREVVDGGRTAWRDLTERKLAEIDDHLERVKAARELLVSAASCGCDSLESCELVGSRRGPHRNVTERLMPVFRSAVDSGRPD